MRPMNGTGIACAQSDACAQCAGSVDKTMKSDARIEQNVEE